MLICGITDWPLYMQKALSLLRPGGWTEMQDLSYVWYRNGRVCSDEWTWMRALREGAQRKGLDMDAGRNLKRRLKEAGFVDVETKEYRIPYGTWATDERPETRRIGRNQVAQNWIAYWHMIPRMLEGMGYGEEQIEEFWQEMKECLAEEVQEDWIFYVTVGRKPNEDGAEDSNSERTDSDGNESG